MPYRTASLLLLLVLIGGSRLMAAPPSDEQFKAYLERKFDCAIERVAIGDEEIVISGRAKAGSDVLVAEILLADDIDVKIENADGLLRARSDGEGRFKLTTKRRNGERDRLLSRWAVVSEQDGKWQLASHPRYADVIATKITTAEEKPKHRKGVGALWVGRPMSDLDDLDLAAATVNIRLSNLVRTNSARSTTPLTYNGQTWHVENDYVAALDQTLAESSKRKIIVSAILLVPHAREASDPAYGKLLAHPDDKGGHYAMPNMNDPQGIEAYAAAIHFLAERYRPGSEKGRIHHWIMHNEVDAGWEWTNAGDKTLLQFVDLYYRSMRLVDLVAKSHDPHAKVFVSLAHHWAKVPDKRFHPGRDILETLLKFSQAEGDFNWAIAYHPYAQDLGNPRTWEDRQVNFTFETPLVTFRNLEVLDAWVKQPRTFVGGKTRRTVHLTEQGLNSRDYSDKSLQEQAAGMAYAWKKMEPLDSIEMFHYHNWADNRGEGGLKIGLRKYPDQRGDPHGKKPIWFVYQALGTDKQEAALEFAKPIIGIQDWKEILHTGEIK